MLSFYLKTTRPKSITQEKELAKISLLQMKELFPFVHKIVEKFSQTEVQTSASSKFCADVNSAKRALDFWEHLKIVKLNGDALITATEIFQPSTTTGTNYTKTMLLQDVCNIVSRAAIEEIAIPVDTPGFSTVLHTPLELRLKDDAITVYIRKFNQVMAKLNDQYPDADTTSDHDKAAEARADKSLTY